MYHHHPSTHTCILPCRPDRSLDSERVTKIRAVVQHFSDPSLKLPSAEGSDQLRSLNDWERMYLSEETITRFMTARWDIQLTIKKLESNLVWRRTMGMDDLKPQAEELATDLESNLVLTLGYTRQGQPILYTWPGKSKSAPTISQIKYTMFMVERAIDLMPVGVQEILFCADLGGKIQTRNGALGVYQQILGNLQTHYPLRLGAAGVMNVHWIGNLVVKCLWPFINTYTREKIHINPELAHQMVDPDELLDLYGGNVKMENTTEYTSSLIQSCSRRREENMKRWKDAGGIIGISEWDFLAPTPTARKEWEEKMAIDEEVTEIEITSTV